MWARGSPGGRRGQRNPRGTLSDRSLSLGPRLAVWKGLSAKDPAASFRWRRPRVHKKPVHFLQGTVTLHDVEDPCRASRRGISVPFLLWGFVEAESCFRPGTQGRDRHAPRLQDGLRCCRL